MFSMAATYAMEAESRERTGVHAEGPFVILPQEHRRI